MDTDQLYVFLDNDSLNQFDLLGLAKCTPPKVKDPDCMLNCEIEYLADLGTTHTLYATELAICAGVAWWKPLAGLGCAAAATAHYLANLVIDATRRASCKSKCGCVCPK